MIFSFQMMDNTTGYQEGMSKKEEDMVRHWSSWRATSDVDNKTDDEQLPRTSSKDQQSQTARLGSIEEIDHWMGKIGQRTGTAFDLSYLIFGCYLW